MDEHQHAYYAVGKNLRFPILCSIAAALATIVLKSSAYVITGSVGLFSDALESCVNLLAAATAYFSLRYSARPIDRNHTYGHEKIEFFSSGLEGVLVGVAGLGTIWFAVRRLIEPVPLEKLDIGVGIALAASAINFIVALYLLRVGREHKSLVLEADGHHLMTDVWTSVGVVAGLALTSWTGIERLDPIAAIVVGAQILRTAFSLVRRSFDGLMDHALSDEEQSLIRETIRKALPAGCDFHCVRSRTAGRRKFLDFHLLVPGSRPVREAHALGHAIEASLREAFPELEVTFHLEPIDEAGSWEHTTLRQLGESTEEAR